MDFIKYKHKVEQYYTAKITEHGPSAKGVDWKDEQSQYWRFQQLLDLIPNANEEFSFNDFGCGYGALLHYIIQLGWRCRYHGYDISPEMIKQANALYNELNNPSVEAGFYLGETMHPADYSVASGVFNVKQDASPDVWLEYILDCLRIINDNSRKGFAFNLMTIYSDPEYAQDKLYYADPKFFFDYCQKNFSRHIVLRHDYGLYEFTMIVRQDPFQPLLLRT